jgi:hypothetical protein
VPELPVAVETRFAALWRDVLREKAVGKACSRFLQTLAK